MADQSAGFQANRDARRNVLIEDYVELIDDLHAEGQEARQVDLAARLGVAQPTVAKMLSRLVADGLVARKPYRGIFLTQAGQNLAREVRHRHRVVEDFLKALGISQKNATIDAEGIEHFVGEETLAAFERILRNKVPQTALCNRRVRRQRTGHCCKVWSCAGAGCWF